MSRSARAGRAHLREARGWWEACQRTLGSADGDIVLVDLAIHHGLDERVRLGHPHRHALLRETASAQECRAPMRALRAPPGAPFPSFSGRGGGRAHDALAGGGGAVLLDGQDGAAGHHLRREDRHVPVPRRLGLLHGETRQARSCGSVTDRRHRGYSVSTWHLALSQSKSREEEGSVCAPRGAAAARCRSSSRCGTRRRWSR